MTTYLYKYKDYGTIADIKATFFMIGDRMLAHIHYDREHKSAYAADKASIRLIMSISDAIKHPLRHLYIRSSFIAENYPLDKPVHINQLPLFNGRLKHRNEPIILLRKNLYGSITVSHIYTKGLRQHLKHHNFKQIEADPCIYSTYYNQGTFIISNTTDDFLITEPTNALIDKFPQILKRKYIIHRQGHGKLMNLLRMENTTPTKRPDPHRTTPPHRQNKI